jgi:hypothetical protein
MTVSRDLFLAILAMDAYNRGYDAGIATGESGSAITGLGDASDGTATIGTATVSFNLLDAEISQAAQSAGFYALAYDTDFGTVVSYRGTDFNGLSALDPDVRFGVLAT